MASSRRNVLFWSPSHFYHFWHNLHVFMHIFCAYWWNNDMKARQPLWHHNIGHHLGPAILRSCSPPLIVNTRSLWPYLRLLSHLIPLRLPHASHGGRGGTCSTLVRSSRLCYQEPYSNIYTPEWMGCICLQVLIYTNFAAMVLVGLQYPD